MKSAIVLVILAMASHVFASTKAQPTTLHMFNSKVAKLLDLNNSANYQKISKNLSAKDRLAFQKLLAKKKGQKVKMFPFMSFLYFKDSKTQVAIELVSVEPLKIRVDGGNPKTIDIKNVRGSFPNWKGDKISGLWSWILPEAHAFNLCVWNCSTDSSASDWELLYGYAASSMVYGGDQPLVTDTDSRIVANEAANFVNEFGITKVTCNPPKWARSSNSFRNYVEIGRKDGGRSLLECDAFQSNCRATPLDSRGEVWNIQADRYNLDHQIIANVLDPLREEIGGLSINVNALDVACDENACKIVASQDSSYAGSISASTMEKISRLDIMSLGDRALRRQTEELVNKYREVSKIEEIHYPKGGDLYPPANRGKAMYAMMACCGAKECVSYVNNQGRVQYEDAGEGVAQ